MQKERYLKLTVKQLTQRALNKMMNEAQEQNNPIVHLTGDGESAFTSRVAQSFYDQHKITFHAVPRMKIECKKGTDPLHTSLGLIDRLIRTIRDMLFNAKLPMTLKATKEMITQYNNAPHSTLSMLHIQHSVNGLALKCHH